MILGRPIPNIMQHGPSASAVNLVQGDSNTVHFRNHETALEDSDTQIRQFGKPEVKGKRRMGVALARAADIENAKQKALKAASAVKVDL